MTKIETAVQDVMSELVGQLAPFNLETLVNRLRGVVVASTDDIEKAMLKCFYVGIVGPKNINYGVFTYNGRIAFAPETMNSKEVENILSTSVSTGVKNTKVVKSKVSPKMVAKTSTPPVSKALKKNYVMDFYSPDRRGRVRIPVRLAREIGVQSGTKVFVQSVGGDSVRVSTRDSKRNTGTKFTADRYGNILFRVPNPEVNYRMSQSRGVVKVVPVTS